MLKFKTTEAKLGFPKINRGLQKIVLEIADWLETNHEIDLWVTETFTTYEQDMITGRRSETHREGRAVDIRTKNWSKSAMADFEEEFSWLDAFGAVPPGSNHRKFIVGVPHGTGPHYHLQVGKDMVKSFEDQYG